MTQKSVRVAIIGRPNVGKSTLLNKIIGEKISITSRKPQTTRHRILGIKTQDELQTIYLDTPGLQQQPIQALHRHMNRLVSLVIDDVDVVLFLIEALNFTAEDEQVLSRLKDLSVPVILGINKIDNVPEKKELLPYIQALSERYAFHKIMLVSAKQRSGLPELEKVIAELALEAEHEFPDDQISDRSLRFNMAEIIREKLTRYLGEELPYALSVQIELFNEKPKAVEIHGLITVNKASQKKIVIGKQGSKLKEVGTEARLDMERVLEKKVYLKLWVKVREGWADDERNLRELGYDVE